MVLLETRGLSKHFDGVTALQFLDLEAVAGEVHAIVGANGAGKSTLMNLLSGVFPPDAGEIRLDGIPVRFASPREAASRGIRTVYQEFSVLPLMSVAENVLLGREPCTRLGFVDRARMLREVQDLLDRHHLPIDARAAVENLSVAQQQMVEIARALEGDARILILDEPTAVLSLNEQTNLFEIIQRLRDRGLLVLYVSHRLDEVFEIADRATALRDGRKTGTVATAQATRADLVRMMIGRTLQGSFKLPRIAANSGPGFEVLYRGETAEARFAVQLGELVGLGGFVGAGRSHLAKRIVGLNREGRLELKLAGQPLRLRCPEHAVREGVVYLTEDRKRAGLFGNLAVLPNTTASALDGFSRLGFIRRGEERRAGARILERLQLVARSLDMRVSQLSGGNQQKVMFGRALLCRPRVLLCDEPTSGVDVGAKQEIYELLIELARRGVAVLVISSEVKELLAICHRVLVMRNRRVVGSFDAPGTKEEDVLLAASSGGRLSRDAASRLR